MTGFPSPDFSDTMAREERQEYDRQKRLPEVSPLRLSVTKVKPRKKRVRRPQTYRTRAVTEESAEFLVRFFFQNAKNLPIEN